MGRGCQLRRWNRSPRVWAWSRPRRGWNYVKAFGTLAADSLANSANRAPRRAVLFYATDDDRAAAAIERLITVTGFDPVRAGGLNAAGRIEGPSGDLSQGGLGGKLLDADQAHAAVAGA
jgi:hypothetical protein